MDDEEEQDDDDDILLVPSPLNGAKVAPCGELASPVKNGPIITHIRISFIDLPLAVAGDRLRPVSGPVDELARWVALRGVVGVNARAL